MSYDEGTNTIEDGASLKQNLIDAGCNDEFICRFMSLDMRRQKREMLSMLALQRRSLLESIHTDERRIYCLDYLVVKLKKE